jgi:monoamine oxidase
VKVYKNGKLEPIHGDLVICAIPATMLKTIEITPALSEAKTSVIQRATYDSASRVFLQTKERFWHKKNLNGFGFGEAEDEIWDSTFGEKGTHGIIQSYTRAFYSMSLTQAIPADRIDLTIKNIEKMYPGLRANFERGHSKCWSEDPWVKGAWGHFSGQQQSIGSRTEGRIYFAGEHLSGHPSWMQGALESGLRVVREISGSRPAMAQTIISKPSALQTA